MKHGLLKRLALAASLLVCMPLCASAAGRTSADDDDTPRIFEEFSLTTGKLQAASS